MRQINKSFPRTTTRIFVHGKTAWFRCDSEIKTFVLKEDKFKDGFFIGILKPFIIDPKEASGGPNRGDSGLKVCILHDYFILDGQRVNRKPKNDKVWDFYTFDLPKTELAFASYALFFKVLRKRFITLWHDVIFINCCSAVKSRYADVKLKLVFKTDV